MAGRASLSSSLWRFDRSDRWGLTALLVLVTAAAALAGVVGPVLGWVAGEPLAVATVGPVVVPTLDAVGTRYGDGEYDVLLTGVGVGQRLLDLLPGVALTVLVAVGCLLVQRLMRGVAAGDAFDPRNVSRLRGLALLLALGVPVVWFARVTTDLALLSGADLGAGGPGALVEVPWLPMLGGMVLALVAEAFRAGTRLRDDVEGLV
ncbi:DUF2975 domain-containing protein [Phycicoccus sp. MAQZ13P-2]|uniref:DUF2975 domain-containing protein n=1 Tax=Phycicoccus mangrovi TaxID=2840470 RepID=UPI001BFFE9D4|nr:DUF2975 domain-containing protein [Phycicoccus mangrovi]MBT9256619.1 DUF2975 domain-containing protein [Phycicoccus mangrovi]MBT9274817.1 DUF2975 domain-containing protein [Phycicoccus mangrovi]